MKKVLPKVPRWRSIQNIPRVLQNPLPVFEENVKKFGPTYGFNFGGGGRLAFFSVNPEFHQHILQKNNRNYVKADRTIKWVKYYLGNNLLTSDGSYWLSQRRLIQPGFHRKRLLAIFDIMQEVIDQYADQLKLRINQNPELEISEEMMSLTFQVVAKSLFSTSMDVEKMMTLGKYLNVLQAFMVKQIRVPLLNPIYQLNGQLKRHYRMKENLDQLIVDVIKFRQQTGETSDDLLQMMLDVRYEDTGKGMSDSQLLDETKVMFLAGHETSANALTWLWYLLTKHPEAMQKVRTEALSVNAKGKFTFEDLNRLEYTTQVIEEGLRLYPPAWLTDRMAIEDDEVTGFHLPKKSQAIIFIYGTHRNPDYWKDPELFKPERFSKEAKKERPPYAYLPFGGGPRLCIGNSFAIMEMQLILAKLSLQFDFEVISNQEIVPHPLVTLQTKNGIKMNVGKRAGAV